MSEAEDYFFMIAGKIPNAKIGKIFGSPCIKMPNGKSAAMLWKGSIVVKLSDEERNIALNLKGAQLFEPMEGKQMKEWVRIPFDLKEKWLDFAKKSAGLVEKMKKVTKRKK